MENLQYFLAIGAQLATSGKDLYAQFTDLKEKSKNSGNGEEDVSEFIFALVLSHLKKKISFQKLLGLFKSIKEKDGVEELRATFEMFWVIGVFIESLPKSKEEEKLELSDLSTSFSTFLRSLSEEALTEEAVLLNIFSEQQIKTFSKVDEKEFVFKRRRINTRTYYYQSKYNLFSQQNEGFAKLLALLIDVSVQEKQAEDTAFSKQFLDGIFHLIGYFDLDPDRVVQCIINFFIMNPKCETLKVALSSFSRKSVTSFLGLKFETLAALPDKGQNSLFRNAILITALLLKHEVIDLPSIWPYLHPGDTEMSDKSLEAIKNAVVYYQDSHSTLLTLNVEEANKRKVEEEGQQNFSFRFNDNQKMWLLESLARVNSWYNFQIVFNYMQSCLDMKMHPALLESVLALFEWGIDKVYITLSPAQFFTNKSQQSKVSANAPSYYTENCNNQSQQLVQPTTLKGCLELISQMLNIVKAYVGCNPILYSKVMRILRHVYLLANPTKEPEFIKSHLNRSPGIAKEELSQMSEVVKTLIGKYMLPGINCSECNPGMVNEFWNVFRHYDYKVRFGIYLEQHNGGNYAFGQLLIKQGKVMREIKDIFNKFNQENKKQYAKKIVKLANNNPLIIQGFILKRILQESFQNFIQDIIGSFSNGTYLSQDLFVYLILQFIYDRKDKHDKPEKRYDEQLGTLTSWFRTCSLFISNFYKKFHNADMAPIVMYLINSFSVSSNLNKSMVRHNLNVAIDTSIFQELISKMSGFEMPNSLNEIQLKALAGGIQLQVQSLKLTEQVRKCKKSQKALGEFFNLKISKLEEIGALVAQTSEGNSSTETHTLAYYFLLLLGQEKAKFFDSYYYDVKTMDIFADMINDSLNLLIFFLRFQTQDYIKYAELMPPKVLRELIQTYLIPIEIAFQICRPGFKPLSSITQKEEQQALFNEIKDIYDSINYPSRLIKNSQMMIEDDEPQEESTMEIEDEKPAEIVAAEAARKVWMAKLDSQEDTAHKKIWSVLKPEMYCTFWLLSLENISLNKEGYKLQIDAIRVVIAEKSSDKNKKEKEKKEIKDLELLINRLEEEDARQTKINAKYEDYLKSIKNELVLSTQKEIKEDMISEICQSCIKPRVMLDQNEALYCSRFVLMLFRLSESHLKEAVRSIKSIVLKIVPLIQFATEKEAMNISIFINDILKPFQNYMDGAEKLKESLRNYIHLDVICDKFAYETYSNYIHSSILDEMFKSVQQVPKSEIQVRNSMILLNTMKDIYPKSRQQSESCVKYLELLLEKFPSNKFKSTGLKIESQLKAIQSVKSRPEAPMKESDREKKMPNNSNNNNNNNNTLNVDRIKKENKDKSRERSLDRKQKKNTETRRN